MVTASTPPLASSPWHGELAIAFAGAVGCFAAHRTGNLNPPLPPGSGGRGVRGLFGKIDLEAFRSGGYLLLQQPQLDRPHGGLRPVGGA